MRIKKGNIRVLAAALIMGLFLLFFMDLSPAMTQVLSKILAEIQFFPALAGAFAGSTKAILLFALIFLVCLVFGRIYCAIFCPLGILQDMMIYLSRRSGRRKRPLPSPGYPFLWYAVLILTALLFVSGFLIPVNFFDPFSIFGRFCNLLFLPAGYGINNLMVELTETFQPYLMTPAALPPLSWPVFWIAYGWLILVTFMAFYHGRLYCNTLCPVGAFFSLFSGKALFRFSIDQTSCTLCGKCQRICRAGCIDHSRGKIDGSRCVACFDCMDICPEKAIHYLPQDRLSMVAREKPRRRRFLLAFFTTAIFSMVLPLGETLARLIEKTLPEPLPVTPPGSLGIDHFSSTCTACLTCVTVCPEKVILPGIKSFGMAGILQPSLDFNLGRCAYTCNACTLVRPSGAILPLSLGEKQRTRIGNVVFEKEKCLVYTHKRDCGACAEVCPTHAVYTVKENNIHHPRIKPEACIGCGACQLVCPVKPKAIHVAALRVHEGSAPPFFQKQKESSPLKIMDNDKEFPF